MRVLFDCTDTAHSRQQSGIPQVVRNLHAQLARQHDVLPVVFNRYSNRWRAADARERRWLDPEHHAAGRIRAWSSWQRVRGWCARLAGAGAGLPLAAGQPLVSVEQYQPIGSRSLRAFRHAGCGPLLAVFHDAVAIRHPEFSPPAVRAAFPQYLEDLLHADVVAAVSQSARDELLAYWACIGCTEHPPVEVVPLGTSLVHDGGGAGAHIPAAEPPLVLCVSTIEPRKNHAMVLDTAERLWADGLRFRLALVGGCNAEVRDWWERRAAAVKAPPGCFIWHGRVPGERLRQLYREACFTVYLSLWEGFGLPVLESLAYGKPCLCSARGGLAESAAGGGCLVVDPQDAGAVVRAWRSLLTDDALARDLAGQARGRRFRTWAHYASDIRALLEKAGARLREPLVLPARVRFRQACRDAGHAAGLVQLVVAGLGDQVRAVRARWQQLQAATGTAAFDAPAAADPPGREADLSQWDPALPADVVSLDIFDTCLVRELQQPEDVFRLLGQFVQETRGIDAGLFATERARMEREARHAGLAAGGPEDTTLEEIHARLARRFGWDDSARRRMMDEEVRLERRFLRADPLVRERACALHRSGIRIIYTSEMYLPEDILRGMLEAVGFPVEGVRIYSSGDTGRSKGTGNLYRKVLDDNPGARLAHVGDNPVSDGEVPAALGIPAAVIRTAKRVHAGVFPNVLATAARDCPSGAGFWERLGFTVAGPVHFAFAAHLHARCRERGLARLHFLSRDGWITRRVFAMLQRRWGNVAEDHYLYASREFLGLGSMRGIDAGAWDFLLKASPLLRVRDIFARAGVPAGECAAACHRHGLGDPDRLLCHHWGYRDPRDRDRLYHALCDCLPALLQHRDRIAASLTGYLGATRLFDPGSAIVDVGWGGSSLAALRALTPPGGEPPLGFYFALFGDRGAHACAWFNTGPRAEPRTRVLKGSVALMEFLFSSPEPTVRWMEQAGGAWRPVFRGALAPAERTAIAAMQAGAEAYADVVLEIQRQAPEEDALQYIEQVLRRLVFEPTGEELAMLGPITHGEGWGTDNRLRLLPRAELLRTPESAKEAFCYAPWKPGLQRLLEQARR